MTVTGMYRIALSPKADERKFVSHMVDRVFKDSAALQLTRITTGFTHTLLKEEGPFRHYAWLVVVELMTDAGYNFAENSQRVQERINDFGVLIGVSAYTNVGTGSA